MISVKEELLPPNVLFKKNYNLKKLLNDLGNPQNNFKVINVVGTNGKGSTSNFICEGLQKKYKKVGLFISPAFLYHNERIQINNDWINDNDLKNIINENYENIKKYELTFFEIWNLIAIIYFNDKKIDIAVIEAGIGGLNDSTNVFENQLAVCVTSLGIDHENILGNKIEDIIFQKISIAKPKVKIFLSYDNKKYRKIINKINNNKKIYAPKLKDSVCYQKYNKGLAFKLLNYLNINIKEFFNTPIGRFTILKNKPLLIIDGCHNNNGAKQLFKQVKNIKDLNILFAFSNDKKFKDILKQFKKFKKNIYLTEFDHFKSWRINKNEFLNYNIIVDWKKFLNENQNKNILICGSLYFIPLVYKWFKEK